MAAKNSDHNTVSRQFTITLHVTLTDPRFPNKEEAQCSYERHPIPIIRIQGSLLGDAGCEHILKVNRCVAPEYLGMGSPNVRSFMTHTIETAMRDALTAMMDRVMV